jgi:membrane protein DedA with SNARE-associated domain
VSTPLPEPLESVAPLLHHYGYAAIGGLIFIESFGIPAPGATMLLAGAALAGAGHLNVFAVAGIAFVAAVAGDSVGYMIGRRVGQPAVLRWGRRIGLTPKRYAKAEGFFTRHGPRVVLIARFIDGLRQINGIIAGLLVLSWVRFLIYNALGAALWVLLWGGFGYFGGHHITTVVGFFHHYHLWILGGVVLAVVAVCGHRYWLVSRRRSSAAEEDTEEDEDRARDAADV